jgi:hypothetical protein
MEATRRMPQPPSTARAADWLGQAEGSAGDNDGHEIHGVTLPGAPTHASLRAVRICPPRVRAHAHAASPCQREYPGCAPSVRARGRRLLRVNRCE